MEVSVFTIHLWQLTNSNIVIPINSISAEFLKQVAWTNENGFYDKFMGRVVKGFPIQFQQ